MADSTTIALTGLAGVLKGILTKADRKLAEDREKQQKKLRELDMRIKAQQEREGAIKNSLLQAQQANRQKLAARLDQRDQAIEQTPGLSSTVQGPPAPQGAERPIPPGPSIQDAIRTGFKPSELGIGAPKQLHPSEIAKNVAQGKKFGAQAEKEQTTANLLSGAGDKSGSDFVPTAIGPGGPTFESASGKAKVAAAQSGAREEAKFLDRQVVDQRVAQGSLTRDAQRILQIVQDDPNTLGLLKGMDSITAARRATGQISSNELIVRTKLDSMAVSAAVMRQGSRPTVEDVNIERNRLGQMFDTPQNFQILLQEYINDLKAIVADRERLSKTRRGQDTEVKVGQTITLGDGTKVRRVK